jgi:hypothetical protein
VAQGRGIATTGVASLSMSDAPGKKKITGKNEKKKCAIATTPVVAIARCVWVCMPADAAYGASADMYADVCLQTLRMGRRLR